MEVSARVWGGQSGGVDWDDAHARTEVAGCSNSEGQKTYLKVRSLAKHRLGRAALAVAEKLLQIGVGAHTKTTWVRTSLTEYIESVEIGVAWWRAWWWSGGEARVEERRAPHGLFSLQGGRVLRSGVPESGLEGWTQEGVPVAVE